MRLVHESSREQASLALHLPAPPQRREFGNLSTAYRARLGFPFIIAVRAALCAQLLNDPRTEHATALSEIGMTAKSRLDDLI